MRTAGSVTVLIASAVFGGAVACAQGGSGGAADTTPAQEEERPMALAVSTDAFRNEGRIPKRHTADGEDVSPALAWTGAPAGTRSFAIVCDDPDAPAGTWVHWVIFNIPADSTGLAEAVPRVERLPDGSVQGRNSWGRVGHNGPSPPPGKPHRYYFKVYALDAVLTLDSKAKKDDLVRAMKGRVLAEGQIMGSYGR
jgi:Raf kinase inhibitor-like YbhB/YbcL family protein